MLIGNSGVGKSSLAQAGILGALKRQAWPEAVGQTAPWPAAFHDSRRWCFLKMQPGTDPIKALVEPFLKTWQIDSTDPEVGGASHRLDRRAHRRQGDALRSARRHRAPL